MCCVCVCVCCVCVFCVCVLFCVCVFWNNCLLVKAHAALFVCCRDLVAKALSVNVLLLLLLMTITMVLQWYYCGITNYSACSSLDFYSYYLSLNYSVSSSYGGK